MSDVHNPNSRLVDQLKAMARSLRLVSYDYAGDLGADLVELAVNRIELLMEERDAALARQSSALAAARAGQWNSVIALLGGEK